MRRLVAKLGSVAFTVTISIGLIILLITSTSMEAARGTSFAQKVFYQTRWFDFLIALLWINIFCSTVIRFPFRKEQVGFLITHIGILGILASALVMKHAGIDGQLALAEGQTASAIKESGYVLAVQYPNQEESYLDLRPGVVQVVFTKDRLNSKTPFCPLQKKTPAQNQDLSGAAINLRITDILEHATESMKVVEGDPRSKQNRAIYVRLKSRQMGLDAASWLLEHDAGNSSSREAMAGAVRISLREKKNVASNPEPVLKVLDKDGKDVFAVKAGDTSLPQAILINKTGYTIKGLVFYPYASVTPKGLANVPAGRSPNPAVSFDLVDAKGNAVHKIAFAFFPDFESMHPGKDKQALDLKFRLEAGDPEDYSADAADGPQISFLYSDTGAWRYEARLNGQVKAEGEVVPEKVLPAGWMDLQFAVQEVLEHAKVEYDIIRSSNDQDLMAAKVVVPGPMKEESIWVVEDRPAPLTLSQGTVSLYLTTKSRELPFTLMLKQFRRIDYPGTMDAQGFESDVVLKDAVHGAVLEKTISMNHPLSYGGYKIFQSSYSDPGSGAKTSIFTVARNPGIPFIYISSIIAVLGAMLQFKGSKDDNV